MERGAGYDEETVQLTPETDLEVDQPILCWVQNNMVPGKYPDAGNEWLLPKRRELSLS